VTNYLAAHREPTRKNARQVQLPEQAVKAILAARVGLIFPFGANR